MFVVAADCGCDAMAQRGCFAKQFELGLAFANDFGFCSLANDTINKTTVVHNITNRTTLRRKALVPLMFHHLRRAAQIPDRPKV
jgi:hypothetical protein